MAMIRDLNQKVGWLGREARILIILPSAAEAVELLGVFPGDLQDLTWVPGVRQAITELHTADFDLIMADLADDRARAPALVKAAARIKPPVGWIQVGPVSLSGRPTTLNRPLAPDRVSLAVRLALVGRSRNMPTSEPIILPAAHLERFAPQSLERIVELDLGEALRESIHALSQASGGRYGVDADLPTGATVAARPSRLRHLLLTLLLDAAQSTAGRGRLQAWIRRSGGHARILIDGRGPGLPHVPFDQEAYRAALTNLIDHQGKLVIHTRAGIGSTYELDFPVAA